MSIRFACLLLTLILSGSAVSGCSTVRNYWSDDKESSVAEEGAAKPERKDGVSEGKKQPERYEILASQSGIKADGSMADVKYAAPESLANTIWPQRGGNSSNAVGPLKLGKIDDSDSVTLGDGNKWKSVLVTEPIVSGGVVYAMDAKGYISAHNAKDIDDKLWVSDAVTVEGKDILGGGLAAAGDYLFVTTGQGDVFALSTKDGSTLWKRNLGVPVRSAPKIFQGVVYAVTIDDQLFALNAAAGTVFWKHRGLGERVGFMTAISPAINDNLVVVAYGSGEIYGLSADSGQEVWNDSLMQTQKTTATGGFTGFVADPVIVGGMAITANASGMTAATHLISGQRIWEKPISGGGTPWPSGNFIFQLTNDAQVLAMNAEDGRIKWVAKLPRFGDEEKQLDPYTYYGPVVAGGEVLIFDADGKLYALSPDTGKILREENFASDLGGMPIIADGIMYYVTKNAKLHSLKE